MIKKYNLKRFFFLKVKDNAKNSTWFFSIAQPLTLSIYLALNANPNPILLFPTMQFLLPLIAPDNLQTSPMLFSETLFL